MKTILKILGIFVLLAAIASAMPLISLYLMKDPTPYTNGQAAAGLDGNKGDHFEFIVLGDNHAGLIFNDSAFLKLIRHINREDRFKKVAIDFAAIAGDVTFRGSEWDYRVYNRLRSMIRLPVISAIGNHDDDKGGMRFFEKYIGSAEFAFADRNSYFIVLNNIANDIGDEKFSWLEKELARSASYTHRFVIAHKAPLSPYQQSWYRPELSPWASRFMKLCEKYNVDMVFSGHEHMSMVGQFAGVKYVTTGGGGMVTQLPRREGGLLHYVVVRVYGDYVDYEVRRISPPFWEILTYYMWKDLFYRLKSVLY
jgi:predicted phosphodiesterase